MPRKVYTPPKPISDRTWHAPQSWYRETIEMVGSRRIRLTVRIDAYSFQSYARAEVWRDDKWSEIHTIPGQQLATRASYVERNVEPSRFDADLEELRRVARAVLS